MDTSQISSNRVGISRATVSRRLKVEIERLREEINAPYRLTETEIAALKRVALSRVLAEIAMRRALQGRCPVVDAVRAQGCARRARADLTKVVLPKPQLLEQLGRSA
ncbi:MAG: hypothetical protein WCC81_22935 [Pseudolabrys sp.]